MAASDARQPEADLLAELRHYWGYEPGEVLVVVGRLHASKSATGKTFHFLEKLTHPRTGVGLIYPGTSAHETTNAFVTPVDAQAFVDQSAQPISWAIAELELSPLKEREKHGNPHKCHVRRDSLRPLLAVPETWQVTVRGPIGAALIAAAAHDAILSQATDTTNKEIVAAEAHLAAAVAKGNLADTRLAKTRDKQKVAKANLEFTQDQAQRAKQDFQVRLDAYEKERSYMEARLHTLAEMAAVKGERLRALGLIDADDLKSLLPRKPAAATGRSLAEAFEGDFSRLAAHVQSLLWSRNLIYPQERIRNFLALTRTSDIVILAGDSGSGKTSMVKAVADALGAACEVIAVKPNWTGPEDLIGYFNPVERKYQSTPFLQALLRAESDPDRLHFILLDEMNLARVEHYFADFLSLLETRNSLPDIPLFTQDEERHVLMENGIFLNIEEEARLLADLDQGATIEDMLKDEKANHFLHLFGGFKNAESVLVHHSRLRRALSSLIRTPSKLRFPPNVRIMGAVNMDDTTHSLSPKVLDRVHVLRFGNPLLTEWDAVEAEIEPVALTEPLQILPEEFGERADYPAFDRSDGRAMFLASLTRQLDPLGVEFGFRAIRQALGYLQAAEVSGLDAQTALNNVILQKVLPKLTLDMERLGADGRARREVLGELLDTLAAKFAQGLAPQAESCVRKLDHLIRAADSNNGLASYWVR